MKDRHENEKFYFKEIMYDNNILYLKFNNIGIKDQLSWIEYNYPIINYGFDKLFLYLELLINTYILSDVIVPIFHIKDDFFYNYFLHLFDLGYKPYLYDTLIKTGDLQILIYNLTKYIFIVIGILVIFSLFKWTFYGGFSNVFLIWASLFISIIITLVNLFLTILSFLLFAYNIISIIFLSGSKITFDENSGKIKLFISFFFDLIQFKYIYNLFSINMKFSLFLNSVRKKTKKLENEEFASDEAFKFKALNNKNYIISALNTDNISKQLFYIKSHDENPISNYNQSSNLLVEQNQEELLDKIQKLKLKIFKKNKKKGLSCNVLLIIIRCLFSLGFIIAALSTSINNYTYYKELRSFIIENYILTSYNNIFFDINFSMDVKNEFPSYTQFWCDFGKIENTIVYTYLIFIIMNICFQIIQYLINIGKIKLDVKKGKSYYIIISINSFFYVIFMIFSPLFLYLFLYSIIIVFFSPFDMDSNILSKVIKDFGNNRYIKLWWKRFIIQVINIILKLFIMIFNSKISTHINTLIIIYLNLDKNKKYEKNTSVVINNNTYSVKIISNEILYLKEMNLGAIYKFKQISIANITNGYVYVKLGHNSITDQISLSEWHYPDLNYIFSQIATLCELIYIILFISIPLFKCLIKEELNYKLYIYSNKIIQEQKYNINKPKFNDIFVYYGDFENGVIKSRFYLYIISILFLLLSMLKRMLFGGFSSLILSTISFIISLIFVALNISYIILGFLMVLFEIFSIICFFQIELKDGIFKIKLFIQIILNTTIFFINIIVLVYSFKLSINLKDLRKELIKFNKVEEIGENNIPSNLKEFEYITIEGNICHLKEVRNDKLQRYLYYSLDNDDKRNANSGELGKTEADGVQNDDILKNDNLIAETENRLKQ